MAFPVSKSIVKNGRQTHPRTANPIFSFFPSPTSNVLLQFLHFSSYIFCFQYASGAPKSQGSSLTSPGLPESNLKVVFGVSRLNSFLPSKYPISAEAADALEEAISINASFLSSPGSQLVQIFVRAFAEAAHLPD